MATPLDLALISQYTGGVNMPNAANANQIAVVNAAGNNLDYKAAAVAVAADGTLAATLAPLLKGSGLRVDQNHLLRIQARNSKYFMQDYFISGGLTSGTIGAFGWNLLGVGSPSITRETGSQLISRKLQLSTSATLNDTVILCLGSATNSSLFIDTDMQLLQLASKPDTAPNNTTRRFFFGMSDDLAVEPSAAVNCYGIMVDTAGVGAGNYAIIKRVGSVGTPTDTGVVQSTSQQMISMWIPDGSSTCLFYVNGTLLGSLPAPSSTVSMNLGVRIQTLANTQRKHHLSYFGFESMAQSVPDTFLDV